MGPRANNGTLQEAGNPQPLGREQTVAAFLERWLESVLKPRVRPSSYRRAEGIVNDYLIPGAGRRPLSRLNAQDVNDLLLDLGKRGLSQRSIQYTRGVLRSALTQAEAWGLVIRNVAALVRGPRVERAEVAALTPERAQRLLEAVRDDPIGPLVVVALGTGLRKGELLGLRWRDVSLAEATLTVRYSLQRINRRFELTEPKTQKSRRAVPLPRVRR